MASDDTKQAAGAKNYAENEKVRARFKSEVMPLLDEGRSGRSKLNSDWGRYHKSWSKEHEFQGYKGRSNIYLPASKKGVETLVAQVVSATFPGDEFFAVEAERQEWADMASDVQVLEQNRVEQAKVRMHAEAHYRQLFMKGNAPVRFHWREKGVLTTARKKKADDELALYGALREDTEELLYSGPCMTPIPAEDFYAWPPTVNNLEDADVVWQDYTTTKQKLNRIADTGRYVKSEAEAASGTLSDKHSADSDRLSSQGITPPQGDTQKIQFVDCSEVFLEFDPDAESADASKRLRPFHFTVTAGGQVLRAVEAKFVIPGSCHPYALGRIGQIVGRLWGSGVIEDIFPLQLLLNDQVNQAMDIANWVLNPGIISNPNVLLTAMTSMEPGFQMLATDINAAMKFERPPQEMMQSSAVLITQTQAWLNDFLGAPPVLQGGSAPGRAFRTATGVGTAQKNAELPLQQVVRLQEIDVWQPMLRSFWNLDRAFAKDEVLVKLGGPGAALAKRIDPKSLYGEYRFRWSASTQLMNVQVRGQQIMQALQVLSAPPTMQALAAMGTRVNLQPLIQRLLRDVFGFRDVEQILVSGPPPMPQMGPGMQPGQPGQQPAGQPGANPLAGAQEGLDPSGGFGDVRNEANDIAAALGAFNGEGGAFGEMEG